MEKFYLAKFAQDAKNLKLTKLHYSRSPPSFAIVQFNSQILDNENSRTISTLELFEMHLLNTSLQPKDERQIPQLKLTKSINIFDQKLKDDNAKDITDWSVTDCILLDTINESTIGIDCVMLTINANLILVRFCDELISRFSIQEVLKFNPFIQTAKCFLISAEIDIAKVLKLICVITEMQICIYSLAKQDKKLINIKKVLDFNQTSEDNLMFCNEDSPQVIDSNEEFISIALLCRTKDNFTKYLQIITFNNQDVISPAKTKLYELNKGNIITKFVSYIYSKELISFSMNKDWSVVLKSHLYTSTSDKQSYELITNWSFNLHNEEESLLLLFNNNDTYGDDIVHCGNDIKNSLCICKIQVKYQSEELRFVALANNKEFQIYSLPPTGVVQTSGQLYLPKLVSKSTFEELFSFEVLDESSVIRNVRNGSNEQETTHDNETLSSNEEDIDSLSKDMIADEIDPSPVSKLFMNENIKKKSSHIMTISIAGNNLISHLHFNRELNLLLIITGLGDLLGLKINYQLSTDINGLGINEEEDLAGEDETVYQRQVRCLLRKDSILNESLKLFESNVDRRKAQLLKIISNIDIPKLENEMTASLPISKKLALISNSSVQLELLDSKSTSSIHHMQLPIYKLSIFLASNKIWTVTVSAISNQSNKSQGFWHGQKDIDSNSSVLVPIYFIEPNSGLSDDKNWLITSFSTFNTSHNNVYDINSSGRVFAIYENCEILNSFKRERVNNITNEDLSSTSSFVQTSRFVILFAMPDAVLTDTSLSITTLEVKNSSHHDLFQHIDPSDELLSPKQTIKNKEMSSTMFLENMATAETDVVNLQDQSNDNCWNDRDDDNQSNNFCDEDEMSEILGSDNTISGDSNITKNIKPKKHGDISSSRVISKSFRVFLNNTLNVRLKPLSSYKPIMRLIDTNNSNKFILTNRICISGSFTYNQMIFWLSKCLQNLDKILSKFSNKEENQGNDIVSFNLKSEFSNSILEIIISLNNDSNNHDDLTSDYMITANRQSQQQNRIYINSNNFVTVNVIKRFILSNATLESIKVSEESSHVSINDLILVMSRYYQVLIQICDEYYASCENKSFMSQSRKDDNKSSQNSNRGNVLIEDLYDIILSSQDTNFALLDGNKDYLEETKDYVEKFEDEIVNDLNSLINNNNDDGHTDSNNKNRYGDILAENNESYPKIMQIYFKIIVESIMSALNEFDKISESKLSTSTKTSTNLRSKIENLVYKVSLERRHDMAREESYNNDDNDDDNVGKGNKIKVDERKELMIKQLSEKTLQFWSTS